MATSSLSFFSPVSVILADTDKRSCSFGLDSFPGEWTRSHKMEGPWVRWALEFQSSMILPEHWTDFFFF